MRDLVAAFGSARAQLYRAFAEVPVPRRMDGCPHCIEPGAERCLLDGPLAGLPPATLARYAAKALTTWGSVDDLRYFLPRLLDCAATDTIEFPDVEIVLGKLALAGWRRWEDAEVSAVETFLRTWWDRTVHRPAPRPDPATLLCGIAATGTELTPYLHLWARLENPEAVRHLHDLVIHEVRRTPQVRMVNPFWDTSTAGHRQTIEWLTGGPAADAVEAAFARETRASVLELLAELQPWLGPT